MLAARYALAGLLCEARDTIEVGCGPGIGLGYLARRARRVVGGDFDEQLVRIARSHYGQRVRLLRLDAQRLPFASASADLVILFEALYYLAQPERFVQEARRVLRPAGLLLISQVNPAWQGFNSSPYSVRYLTAPQLRELLASAGFEVELYAGFLADSTGWRGRALAAARRAAVALHLIPQTMKGKERLKRLLYGPLRPLPAELQDPVEAFRPEPVPAGEPVPRFKVLYAVGRRPRAPGSAGELDGPDRDLIGGSQDVDTQP